MRPRAGAAALLLFFYFSLLSICCLAILGRSSRSLSGWKRLSPLVAFLTITTTILAAEVTKDGPELQASSNMAVDQSDYTRGDSIEVSGDSSGSNEEEMLAALEKWIVARGMADTRAPNYPVKVHPTGLHDSRHRDTLLGMMPHCACYNTLGTIAL